MPQRAHVVRAAALLSSARSLPWSWPLSSASSRPRRAAHPRPGVGRGPDGHDRCRRDAGPPPGRRIRGDPSQPVRRRTRVTARLRSVHAAAARSPHGGTGNAGRPARRPDTRRSRRSPSTSTAAASRSCTRARRTCPPGRSPATPSSVPTSPPPGPSPPLRPARGSRPGVSTTVTPSGALITPPPPHGLGPQQLQAAYGLPSATAGNGQTVYIVDAYDDPSAESDLAVYRSTYGLPPCTSANRLLREAQPERPDRAVAGGDTTGWAE